MVRLRTQSDFRHEVKGVFVEGAKQIADVCATTGRFPVNLVLDEGFHRVTNAANLLDAPNLLSTRLPEFPSSTSRYIVPNAVMKKISGVDTPQGIVAEFEMPKYSTCFEADLKREQKRAYAAASKPPYFSLNSSSFVIVLDSMAGLFVDLSVECSSSPEVWFALFR